MRKFSYLAATLLLAGLAGAQPPLRLKTLMRNPAGRARRLNAPLKTRTFGRSHLLIQFANSPDKNELRGLDDRGVSVLSYVPDFALSVSAWDNTSFDGLNIRWVGRLLPDEKISPKLDGVEAAAGSPASVLVEFYSDVDPNDARAIVNLEGLVIQERPDLLPNHLLVQGTGGQMLALAGWDEVSYVFPASRELIRGTRVQGCAGALTSQGLVGQAVAVIDDGWDGPGQGSANLKYGFVQLTEKLPADAQEAEIVRAFNEWAKYAKLSFAPTTNTTGNQTIAVLFASGAHGDSYPFDGPGGVLAHTFYPVPSNPEPIAGDMHFDDAESWNIGADVDLFSIALHEIGHALGLGHSDSPGDVMYPYYTQHTGLAPNDIAAILQLYAAQDGGATPDPGSPTTPLPSNPLALTVQNSPGSTMASSIALSGTTSGGVGTVQVSWSTSQGAAGIAQGSSQWTIAAIPLVMGLNVVNIQVNDSQQNRVSQNLIVTRQPASTTVPPQSPAPTPGADATPPSIVILFPSSTNISTSASSLVFSGTASDNVGVAKVTWSSSTGGSGTATGATQWATGPVTLYVGTTTVTIRAYDAAGNMSWRSVTVTRR